MNTSNFTFVGENIIPEEWKLIGSVSIFSFETDYGMEKEMDINIVDNAISLNEEDTYHIILKLDLYERCNCCNHIIKNKVIFQHKITEQLIHIGYDCSSTMHLSFDVVGAKKQTKLERAKFLKQMAINKILIENPGLQEDLECNNKIIRKIAENFRKYANISQKQIDFVRVLAVKRREMESKSSPCVSGKITDEYTILSVKVKENSFNKNSLAITCKHKSGYLIYGNLSVKLNNNYVLLNETSAKMWGITLENNVFNIPISDFINTIKGKVISFTTTITPSKNDPFFGVFKRMSKLTVK